MNPQLKKLIEWLNKIAGQRLTGVLALIYVYDDREDNNSPQAIYLEFDNNLHGCVRCASDGESIEYDSNAPAEIDLGRYGNEILKYISNQGPWRECVGEKLNDSFVLIADNNVCMGVRLLFQSGKSVDIVNLGDELYVYDFLPESIVAEEHIETKRINSNMTNI
ncbi:uncharacterized protein sS8_3923 [Methylocaldum marinum]|uniref:Uncharacterized protein n=1 Tax=Methylocaldum marinum TaxID=1432792 RepID=A0A250KW58_9GAMM|nr:uncharacterized protein sS8_3923 [Methylocaldum marinum]